jgi:outer membrane immunogenic protein
VEDGMRASLGVAAIAVISTWPVAAEAADLWTRPAYPPAPYAPVVSPWTGFYVGGFVGGTISDQKLDEHGADQFFAAAGAGSSTRLTPASDPETPFGLSGHKSSLTGGGFLGYNYQYGRIVVGVEGDFAAKQAQTSGSRTVISSATYDFTPNGLNGDTDFDTAGAARTEFFTGQVRQNWDASARLRLGGLITPSILLYGTGGVVLGSVDSAFSYSATTMYSYEAGGPTTPITHTTFGAGSWNDTRIGWTAGLGVEAAIAAHWKVRAEYRFADLGHYSKTVPLTRTTTDAAIPNTGSSAAVANVNADFHTLRLGVAYGF